MKKIWPLRVTATTHDEAGKRHRINRTVEGSGDAYKAMLDAVLAQKRPGLWLGVDIRGVTLLGQKLCGVVDWKEGEYFLRR